MMLSRVISENVDMATQLAEDLGYVSINRGQLEQVILNLVINAADAMPAGGRLTLKTSNVSVSEPGAARCPDLEPGDYVHLSVSDTGEGMSEHVIARIFEPFFTTKDSNKGTGLGLSICHGIITRSGGT
ncbi:MAG: hybrid sensor histidine kinase/response regulator, partial [SAR202 cluster bacterium]|nr:hybrid sensor histidine kinase/response regulator [SAR202 cluster bacterium]